MKNKIIKVLAAMSLVTLTACSSEEMDLVDEDKISIVTTIYAEYDWVKNIVGEDNDDIEVTLLLDDGTDMHSYQPTFQDLMNVMTSDLFIYVGGESDEWVNDVLEENPELNTINLMDVLGDGVKEEEIVEGMQEEEGEEESENDEHVWLSLQNAYNFVGVISDAIGEIDEANAETYQSNAASYQEELLALDDEYQKAIDEATYDTLVFGDRFPFRYLVDDYGIAYYAAFPGCSSESDASFATVTFLAEKIDELGIDNVLVIDGSDETIAETIISNTTSKDQNILVLDSMQTSTLASDSYLEIMRNNLVTIQEALN